MTALFFKKEIAMHKAVIISFINSTVLVTLIVLDLSGILRLQPFLSYQWHKLLHVTGIVLFFGNMIAGPFWLLYGLFSKNLEIAKFSLKLLFLTDIALTIPGVDLAIWNGLIMANALGGIHAQPWILNSIYLLFAMWVLTVPVEIYQNKIDKLVNSENYSYEELKKIIFGWSAWGMALMIPPTIVVYYMFFKPM